jgi:alanine-glyoxylate transaminase/serine-glyoxylate transaminase/serine-pyruvate transaminase
MQTGIHRHHVPGPGNIPADVARAMIRPMPDCRAGDPGDLIRAVLPDLKRLFRTRAGQVMVLPGSGTSAWAAAIASTLNPGDRVLMARHGQFSRLWAEMAQRLGLQVQTVDCAWGAGTPVNEFARRLGADREGRIKAVFVTHNEASTGVTSDVAAVRRALDSACHEALLFVDGGSSIGAIDFRMDDWGVDVAVAGSQRGSMLPAGLGIMAVSPRAMAAACQARMLRSRFDFGAMRRAHAAGRFPGTPPVQLLHGLRAALDRLFAEGLDMVIARHRRLAAGVRAAVQGWGLTLVAEHPALWSDTVSAVRVPPGVDARAVIAIARDRYNGALGTGLGPLAGKVFRIGHLGDLNEGMCLAVIGIAELALHEAGAPVALGSGLAAARQVYARPAPKAAAEPARIAA